MRKLLQVVMSVTVLFWGVNASADLIGDEVFLTCMQSSGSDHELCEGNGALPAIVGAGVEYPDYFNFENSLSIDVGANSIDVSFDNGPFCGWFTCAGTGHLEFWLSGLDWRNPDGSLIPGGQIVGLVVQTNMTNVLTDWGANSVYFALPETSVTDDLFLSIELLTRHDSVQVPEPTTLTMLGLGFLGLGLVRRRKRTV